MFSLILKTLKALNSEQSSAQLAAALCLALVLGFTPTMSLHNIVVILIALWFRVNLGILILSYPLFAFCGFLLSPVFDSFGNFLLNIPSMQAVWTDFFNTAIGRWSNFYYTGMIGSLVASLVATPILYPVFKWLVESYRSKCVAIVEKLRISKMLKATKLWQRYSAI
jgi:uncharacterized protein (TIGR03546 family)